MLTKLLKYELRATARWFLPMYAGIFAFALINRFFMLFSPHIDYNSGLPSFVVDVLNLVQGGAVMLYVLIILATFALTVFVMLQRFYKNLLGDEGYLMFTLPVNPALHIWSKMLISILWMFASVVVSILSLLVISVDGQFFVEFAQAMAALPEALRNLNFEAVHVICYIIEFIVLCFVSTACAILTFYAAIALGHTRHRHRILYSFGFYMVIDFAFSLVQGILMLIGGILLDHQLEFLLNDTIWFLHILFIGMILLCAAQAVVCFLLTNHVLSKKLNLE